MLDATARPGRNNPCHCGSGNKYKRCCLSKDEETDRAARAEAAELAPESVAEEKAPTQDSPERPRPSAQPWKRAAVGKRTFPRFMAPGRRSGS